MVEWSDLRGAASRDADVQLKELMKEYDGKLRWVHYSVADTNRAEESERIHQFARAVYEDGKNSAKFWQVRDLLISTPDGVDLDDAKLSRIGKEVGVDYDKLAPQIREDKFGTVIALDMGLGLRFGVRQGPAVFVNGRPARAATSAQLKSAVKALINEELMHAEQTLAKGVDKSKLYDTIVEGGLWSLDDNPANRQAANAKAKSVVFPKLQLGESSAKR
jgi:protein-disulfide isomerase